MSFLALKRFAEGSFRDFGCITIRKMLENGQNGRKSALLEFAIDLTWQFQKNLAYGKLKKYVLFKVSKSSDRFLTWIRGKYNKNRINTPDNTLQRPVQESFLKQNGRQKADIISFLAKLNFI
jgi:hypothetical protein